LADYWPTVDQVSIECRPSINWDVDQDVNWGFLLRVSIDTLPQMPYTHDPNWPNTGTDSKHLQCHMYKGIIKPPLGEPKEFMDTIKT